jgi:hypothetical protein
MGIPKFPKLGFSQLWSPITLCLDLQLRQGLKQSRCPCQGLFNDTWHATCTQGNQGNSWLLVVGSQIGNLTTSPSFGHNLCFMYPNGSCEPILTIYILIAFQWYKEFFNPMSFDPWNCFLNIQKSVETPTPKMGTHLGVWGFIPSHSPTLSGAWNVTPTSLLARTFASLCLGCEPKARVVIGVATNNFETLIPWSCWIQNGL